MVERRKQSEQQRSKKEEYDKYIEIVISIDPLNEWKHQLLIIGYYNMATSSYVCGRY